MSTLRIKDWNSFQHYQDGKRKPEWIKLYRRLLDDVEWHELDPKASKVLVMLWLLASENGGELPSIKKIAFRLRLSESETKSTISKLSHWVEQDASDTLAEGYQDASLEEEREEEENKKEKKKQSGASTPTVVSVLSEVLDDERTNAVIAHRRALKAPLTPHAAKLLARDLSRVGDPNENADMMIRKNWRGFDPSWLNGRATGPPQHKGSTLMDACEDRLSEIREPKLVAQSASLLIQDSRTQKRD